LSEPRWPLRGVAPHTRSDQERRRRAWWKRSPSGGGRSGRGDDRSMRLPSAPRPRHRAGSAESAGHPGRTGPISKDSLTAGLLRTARPASGSRKRARLAAARRAACSGTRGPYLRDTGGVQRLFLCDQPADLFVTTPRPVRPTDAPPSGTRRLGSGVVPINLPTPVRAPQGRGRRLRAPGNGTAGEIWRYTSAYRRLTTWGKGRSRGGHGCVALRVSRVALAGGVAPGCAVNWFLSWASFGSLFMVAGKRHASHLTGGSGRPRATPGQYSLSFLRTCARSRRSGSLSYCVGVREGRAAGHGAIGFSCDRSVRARGLRYACCSTPGRAALPRTSSRGDPHPSS